MTSYPILENLPDEHLTEIGRIAVKWAYLEWRMLQITQILLELGPRETRLAIRQPRVTDRLNLIQALLEMRKISEGKVDFAALYKVLETCSTWRDLIEHSVWITMPKFQDPVLQRTRGTWTPDPKQGKLDRNLFPEGQPISAGGLRKLVEMIDAAQHTLRILEGQTRHALETSPEKHRRQDHSPPPQGRIATEP